MNDELCSTLTWVSKNDDISGCECFPRESIKSGLVVLGSILEFCIGGFK